MSLSNFGMNRRQLRQGGGHGTGSDHVEELMGATELYIYQTPNTRPKGYTGLKTFLEAQECEIIFTADAPPELSRYETMRITHNGAEPIPVVVIKRAHSWAHQRNYLHSFFKPLYR